MSGGLRDPGNGFLQVPQLAEIHVQANAPVASQSKVMPRSSFGPYRTNLTSSQNKLMKYLKQWKKSIMWRLLTFVLAMTIWICCTIEEHNQIFRAHQRKSNLIIFSVFATSLTQFAKILLIFPLLLSKYKPLSYLLKMKGWYVLSQLLPGIYLTLPMIFVRYYYELHQMLTINLYQMLFYSIGSYIYSLPFAYLIFMLLLAPTSAFLSIWAEAEEVRRGKKILRFDYQFINSQKLKFNSVMKYD